MVRLSRILAVLFGTGYTTAAFLAGYPPGAHRMRFAFCVTVASAFWALTLILHDLMAEERDNDQEGR